MDEAAKNLLNRNVAALADGERSAFDPVFRAVWPVLVQFIAALGGDRATAEDMAQQALLKIFSRVATFDRSKDALAWSLAIAANEYRSALRKRSNRATELHDWILTEPADDDSPETIAIRDNLAGAARTVLGQLRPCDFEAVVVALYKEQRPPSAAFRKRLQRALDRARLIWRQRYGNER